MFMDGTDATSAAYEVGYESVSQFNREYKRFFGQPPIRDIRTLRFQALRRWSRLVIFRTLYERLAAEWFTLDLTLISPYGNIATWR